MIVWAAVNSSGVLFLSLDKLTSPKEQDSVARSAIMISITSLWVLFSVAWTVIGSIWLYTDHSCKDCNWYSDFYNLWAMTLSILILSYMGSFCGIIGIFVGIYVLCRRYKNSELDKDINE
jgi:hypothetical protein